MRTSLPEDKRQGPPRSPNRKPRKPKQYHTERHVGFSYVFKGEGVRRKAIPTYRIQIPPEVFGPMKEEAERRGITLKELKEERSELLKHFIEDGRDDGIILPPDVADFLRPIAKREEISLGKCVANILRKWMRDRRSLL